MQFLLPLHGLLMLLGLILIITAVFIAKKRKGNWFNTHKKFGISGLLAALFAFVSIYALKATHHYPHFKSDHGQFGLITLISLLLIILLGILGSKGLPWFKKIHKAAAWLITLVMIGVAVVGLLAFLKILQH